jgi:beta-N-acetylhexosaminidase
MAARAFITGVSSTALTPDERAFLRQAMPWGLILFRRNIETAEQVRALIAAFRDSVGTVAPVLVDQEGGRVQRLAPPDWPRYPAGAVYGRIYDGDSQLGLQIAQAGARLIAADLWALGIDVDCLPLADLCVAGADRVIGDRAYGETPEKIAAIARAVAAGLADGGVLPVLKHLPGHGRATLDSHKRLPVVDASHQLLEATDFQAFRPLADLCCGMTAHVVFSAIDPVAPATTSGTMVQQVIRGSIGFRGLLMTDDISMGALSGSMTERVRAALAAGCDIILHCNGRLDEMQAIAAEVPELAGDAQTRAAAALASRRTPIECDLVALRRTFEAGLAAYGTTVDLVGL